MSNYQPAADFNKNRYKYFRWTPRNAWHTLLYAALIPTALGYIAYKTDVRFLFDDLVLLVTRSWLIGICRENTNFVGSGDRIPLLNSRSRPLIDCGGSKLSMNRIDLAYLIIARNYTLFDYT